MRTRPKRPCSHPGCPELTDGGLCDKHRREREHHYDAQRGNAASRMYDARWQKARRMYLIVHPLCAICERQGRVTPATVVDHIIPHRGNYALFWDESNWQSLCKPHHDAKTAREDGRFGQRRAETDVVIVCGPPAAGKTTYVKRHMQAGDIVVDLDLIKQAVSLTDWYSAPDSILPFACEARDAILNRLLRPSDVKCAWVITLGADASQRRELRERFGGKVIVLPVPESECMRRIKADARRTGRSMELWERLVKGWWQEYVADPTDIVVEVGSLTTQWG